MNQTISKTIRAAAFGAFAALLMGTSASACSLPGGMGLRPVNLADGSVRLGVNRPEIRGPQAQRGSGPASVVGLWEVTYSSGGAVVDMGYEVFHSDGTEMVIDITPPAEGNTCLGVYVQMTPTTYKLTHPAWVFDGSGNLAGTALFQVTVNMTSADAFTGSYSLTYYDLHGSKGQVYNGTMTATRITPEY